MSYQPGMLSQKPQYSIMDIPEFTTNYSSGYSDGGEKASTPEEDTLFSKDTSQAIISGAQSGGLSGALTSGGLTSMLGAGGMAGGGPYALAGGLILSQIEAGEKAKAAAEQEKIANEKARMKNTQNQYASMANQRFGV